MGTIEEEGSCEIPLMVIKEDVSNIEAEMYKKLDEIEGVDLTRRSQLEQLLYENKEVFEDQPGLITGYKHYFKVTDNTPYLQKGWPVPIKLSLIHI